MRTLTIDQLISVGACTEELELFRDTFGESVEVTVERAEWFANKFSFEWAAGSLLSEDAWLKFNKVDCEAAVEFDKTCDVAYEECARLEYLERHDAAVDKLNKVQAIAFANLYNSDAHLTMRGVLNENDYTYPVD